MNLALFDFDGTITSKDSFLLFIRFAAGKKYYTGCARLSPKICLYLAGLYPNYRLKEDFLTTFLSNWTSQQLSDVASAFSKDILKEIIRPGALERIHHHQHKGDKTVLVSASPEALLAPWCLRNNMDLLGTRLQVKNGRTTGKIEGKNCWGEEKVTRIQTAYQLDMYQKIYAYGDSKGDLPMLKLADVSRYKPFL